jgi:ABC-type bacteriocin/lantibiotic exporter with double-glycine peptidase domain
MQPEPQRNATLIETLSGLETLKAMGAESIMQRQWEEATRFLASQNLRARNLNLRLTQSSSTVQRIVQLSVIVVGVYMIADGKLTLGGFDRVHASLHKSSWPLCQTRIAPCAISKCASGNEVLDRPLRHTQ